MILGVGEVEENISLILKNESFMVAIEEKSSSIATFQGFESDFKMD